MNPYIYKALVQYLSGRRYTHLNILPGEGYKSRKMEKEKSHAYLDYRPKRISQRGPLQSDIAQYQEDSRVFQCAGVLFSVSQIIVIWLISSHACCSRTLGRIK